MAEDAPDGRGRAGTLISAWYRMASMSPNGRDPADLPDCDPVAGDGPVTQSGDGGERDGLPAATKNLVEADVDLAEATGTVVAVVTVEADDSAVAAVLDDHGFGDVVTSVDPVSDGQREGLSCRGPADRVRDLVARLDATTGVADVTVVLLCAE